MPALPAWLLLTSEVEHECSERLNIHDASSNVEVIFNASK